MTMNNILEHALKYAARGFNVFPVHSIINGVCSCQASEACKQPGKHPRTANGFKSATTDEEKIRAWWNLWPNANVAISTGESSGILVVDIESGGIGIHSDKEFPVTLSQNTGGGGIHFIYSYPNDGKRYKNGVRNFELMDSRAEGGYILVPPSNHISGGKYMWFDFDAPISAAPQWWLDAIVDGNEKFSVSGETPTWNPDGDIPYNAIDMLRFISAMADNYDTWFKVGMALHYTDPLDGFDLFDWWSGLSKKYDADAVRQQWNIFSRRQHAVLDPITFDTIRKWAGESGWEDPDIALGSMIAESIINNYQEREIAKLATGEKVEVRPPDMLIPDRGLIADIVDYILKTSILPQPVLALGAAIAFVGVVAGQKYRTQTKLYPNIYIIGMAETGHGKDHARKCIKNIAFSAGLAKYLGGEDIASGQAVISALVDHPEKLFLLDEIGLMLQSLTNSNASSFQREIISNLLKLYSSSGSVYLGKEYADKKANKTQQIVNPCACLYGTTTPEAFYASMTSAGVLDGTLPRMIMMEASPGLPDRQRPVYDYNLDIITEKLQAIDNRNSDKGNLAGVLGDTLSGINSNLVMMTDQAIEAWDELTRSIDDIFRTSNMARKSVYTRVGENTAKLALIYAISINSDNPVIDVEAIAWSKSIVLWAANSMVSKINENISDNQHEANLKFVANIIKAAGKDGITKTKLSRKVKKLGTNNRNDIIKQLIEMKAISVSTSKTQISYNYVFANEEEE